MTRTVTARVPPANPTPEQGTYPTHRDPKPSRPARPQPSFAGSSTPVRQQHARGKQQHARREGTSTERGARGAGQVPANSPWNYPRQSGEHHEPRFGSGRRKGSPPPERGALSTGVRESGASGVRPLTRVMLPSQHWVVVRGEHPRQSGEHCAPARPVRTISSPGALIRVRTRLFMVRGNTPGGISSIGSGLAQPAGQAGMTMTVTGRARCSRGRLRRCRGRTGPVCGRGRSSRRALPHRCGC